MSVAVESIICLIISIFIPGNFSYNCPATVATFSAALADVPSSLTAVIVQDFATPAFESGSRSFHSNPVVPGLLASATTFIQDFSKLFSKYGNPP